jgi:poly(3-hydroxybutyrate) depolymerase
MVETTRAARTHIASCAFFALLSGAVVAQDHADKRPFTVADSIEMTRIVGSPGGAPMSSQVALFAPDGAHFLVQTTRGDIARNVNVESLLLFESIDVDRLLGRSASPSAPRTIVQVDVGVDWGGLSQVRWIDATHIGFVSQDKQGHRQAFVQNLAGGSPVQLTQGAAEVAAFAAANGNVLHYSHLLPESPQVDVVTGKSIGDALFADRSTETPLRLSARTPAGEVEVLPLPPRRLDNFSREIWLSSTGNYAVVSGPAINAPKHWAEYQVPYYELFGYTAERVSADPTSAELLLRTRYQLVDMQARTVRDLFDAPAGTLSLNRTPRNAFWADDDEFVIVSGTYLPLTDGDEQTRRQRARRPAIAEVNIRSGAIKTIEWEPIFDPERRAAGFAQEVITSIAWDSQRQLLTVNRTSHAGAIVRSVFRRSNGHWRRTADGRPSARLQPKINLVQGLNDRPRLYAEGGACSCRRLLLDPNPQAERLLFGRAEVYEWRDSNEIAWRGGLIYPPGYIAGARYPLVVQTHGFDDREFLIDGAFGVTTAMAAQPMANAGILVLQVEDNRRAISLDASEGPRVAAGIRAAVEQLIESGRVDPGRVGLIGFSRTGYHALHLLASAPTLLTAATISDAIQQGYVSDVLMLNQSVDAMAQLRALSGGAPDIRDLDAWISRNPLYKLPSVTAAIRLEANGRGGVLGLWETFAVLKNAKRPVDFISFPEASHILRKPAERIASQGGNVDWFRFWLQDYEDPSAEKAAQYRRWRSLRELRSQTR